MKPDPPVCVALFSGGHDSLCATHYAMTNGLASEVAHVNTGIGVEATREFVRDTCRAHGWPLTELYPVQSYDEIVLEHGFPGPATHPLMYRLLKERPLAAFARLRKPWRGADAMVFVTGVRKQESSRRMRGPAQAVQVAAKLGWTWHAPIIDWSKADCNAYIEAQRLRRNPVVDALHMSGECLCGAFARPGERAELLLWYPEVDARIAALEARATAAGVHGDVWGFRPPNVHRDQLRMAPGMLCAGCA